MKFVGREFRVKSLVLASVLHLQHMVETGYCMVCACANTAWYIEPISKQRMLWTCAADYKEK